jgi:uncharacterized YccA/Bax inhibitor family protein
MTVQGTINKTALPLVLAFTTAAASWVLGTADTAGIGGWALGAALAGLVAGIATFIKPRWSPVTGPLYALLEGVFLGLLSMVFEARYPGIAIQAVALTFGVLGAMLLVYKTGLVKVTQRFRAGVAPPPWRSSPPTWSRWSSACSACGCRCRTTPARSASSSAWRSWSWPRSTWCSTSTVWLYLELLRLLAKLRER